MVPPSWTREGNYNRNFDNLPDYLTFAAAENGKIISIWNKIKTL